MQKSTTKRTAEKTSRRAFLKTTAAAATLIGAPSIVPSTVFGAFAPSNRITLGHIGVGNQGFLDLEGFLQYDDTQVLAVCDVNRASYGYKFENQYYGREPAREFVNKFYAEKKRSGASKGCDAYTDFRDVLAREDIDAVIIVVPDHWHAIMTIQAADAGKDIYCEKPLSLTIGDGRAMVEAVRRNGVVLQTGSHERSKRETRFGCELVRNGRIGELKRIFAPVGFNSRIAPEGPWKPQSVPEGFDYDMWLGPAPWASYHPDRCFYKFRFILDYSGGQVTNYGAHSNDMAQWGGGFDGTGPVEVEDAGSEFPKDGLFDVATKVSFRARYANGVELLCQSYEKAVGARFEGTEGWVQIGRLGFKTHPESLATSVIGPNEIHLYESNDHYRDFLDCIKSRKDPITPVEIGHRSSTVCHLGNIAMRLGRKLKWDPEKEVFVGDDEANRMIRRTLRAPWHL